jgi:GNAT superfamily N-acetyltransferase
MDADEKGVWMDLEWIARMEEAALNAWPSSRQMVYDGWLLRFTGGPSKRVNAVNIRYSSTLPLAKKIDYCEAVYAGVGLPCLFRVPEPFSSPELEEALTQSGYHSFDVTYVLTRELAEENLHYKDLRVEVFETADWIPFKGEISGAPSESLALQEQIINCIAPQKRLIVLFTGERPVACGMGVLEGELLGYFSIYTHHDARRKGYARQVMATLTHWGRRQGATRGYLQVESFNQPARTLYAKLGFELAYAYQYFKKE